MNAFKPFAALAALSCMAALSACATTQSTKVASFKATTSSAGATYFLPKRLVKLTVTRVAPDAADLIKKRDGKVPDRDAAKATFDDATAKRKDAEAKLKAFKPDPADTAGSDKKKAELEKAVADTTTKEALAKTALETAQATLNSMALDIAAAQQGGGCSYTTSLEVLPVQADAAERYVADFPHNPLRDDHSSVAVATTGLLTSVNVVTTDRTGDIIAEALSAVAVFSSGVASRDGKSVASNCAALPTKFVQIFDPKVDLATAIPRAAPLAPVVAPVAPVAPAGSDDIGNTPAPVDQAPPSPCAGLSGVNARLCANQFPIRISMDAASIAGLSAADRWPTATTLSGPSDGVFYRSAVPVILTLEQKDDVDWQPVDAALVALPQAGPISFMPMKASAFVKTTSDVTFTDGQLTSWTQDRPSEVLEIVRLPLKVLSQALKAVSVIVKLRVDYASDSKALVDKNAELIASQAKAEKVSESYDKLMRCVNKARSEGQEADACFPATP